jgi:hypothetical protein
MAVPRIDLPGEVACFVKIDAAGPGVSLGSRTLMQVAIVPASR